MRRRNPHFAVQWCHGNSVSDSPRDEDSACHAALQVSPEPASPGQWTQWPLFAPGGCPLTPDYALSDAQRFSIGE